MTPVNVGSGARALGGAIASALDAPTRLASALAAGTLGQRGRGCCEIPPPCWEPRPAGRCVLTLAPGSVGTLRVHVTNCGWTAETVAITALGHLAAWMTFVPTHMALHPQERATFVARVQVPTEVKPGTSLTGPLLVLGCIDHFVRLEVTVAECAAGELCCDIAIDDCQDQIHHWYDHFYCARPCHRTRVIRDPAHG